MIRLSDWSVCITCPTCCTGRLVSFERRGLSRGIQRSAWRSARSWTFALDGRTADTVPSLFTTVAHRWIPSLP